MAPRGETGKPDPATGSGPFSRRGALRALFTVSAVAGTGAALAPLLAAETSPAAPRAAGATVLAARGGRGGETLFDEVYRGRRIQGRALPRGAGGAKARIQATVDGRVLPLTRRADGGCLSPVDHYDSYATPLEATRAAVDELGGARLSPAAARHHH
ncbi:tyrosinase co-factor protein [Streptomyces tsukubensis]|uniref:Tyrosinase n=2 Tax=Streptomyces tsukubensis TaxID=83656 RepID=A0A1V4A0S3_9ACTN|nr:hypothetical protein B1H18_30855 [Streptomyces tsukubensis]QFR98191.1 tyrosinase co-factor protein [Streptomyces tsukubensis]